MSSYSFDELNADEFVYTGEYSSIYETEFFMSDGSVNFIHISDTIFWFVNPSFMKEHGYSTFGGLLEFIKKKGVPTDSFYRESLDVIFDRDSDEEGRFAYSYKLKDGFDPSAQLVSYREESSYTSEHFRYHLLPTNNRSVEEVWSLSGRVIWNGDKFVLYISKDQRVPQEVSISRNLSRVFSYDFRPTFGDSEDFQFKSDRKDVGPHYGVEIELSTLISPEELQRIVVEVEPKQEPFFYFKHDGSIYAHYEYTYEIVTMPCKRRFLIKNLKILFDKLDRLAEDKGDTLSDYFDTQLRSNNGLHIHVEKNAFRSRLVANRFACLWNQWSRSSLSVLNALSKRPNGIQNQEYCRTHPGMNRRTLPWRLKNGAQVNDNYERRSACREAPATLEVRIFQGLFDLDHILNSIQAVDAMFYFAHEMSLSSFDMRFSKAFKTWVKKKGTYVRVQNILKGVK